MIHSYKAIQKKAHKHFERLPVAILLALLTLVVAGCAGTGSPQTSNKGAPSPTPSPTPGSTGTLSATPGGVSFGNVALNTNSSQTVKISNVGTATVTVTQHSLAGSGLSTGLTTPVTLNAGQSVNVQISFSPTVAGPVNGDLVLNSNDTTLLTIPVSGSGVAPLAHSVAISWTASSSSGVQGYNVYRSTISGGPYTKISSALSATALAFTDVTPISGAKYFYIVTAVGANGAESAASTEVPVTVPTP